ncbi:MAG: aspartate/glutamate racemase family protein [Desulfatiglandales bacterium]
MHEAREMCSFPVFGVFETSAHVACMLGDRFSGVAMDEKQASLYNRKVREYGVKEK